MRTRWIPPNAEEITHPAGLGVCYLTGTEKNVVLGYHGRATNRDFNYRYRTEEQARRKAADFFIDLEVRAELMKSRKAARPTASLNFYEIADGQYLTTAQTASLVRQALAAKFPGVKFSVRSAQYSMGSSVDVFWTDGPSTKEVDTVAGQFESAGFDGSIDLKYSWSSWLSPDLTAIVAHSSGTSGSGGYEPRISNPKPEGAKLVRMGADYVHTHRRES